MRNPVVSACIITYNQMSFIDECINGALMQRAQFDIEIDINDDNSNDGTAQFCKKVTTANPGKINFYSNQENLGMIGNWMVALKRCKGKYVALCEGDDYWTDRNKLQKQVEFLEANPDYSICFHQVNVLEDAKKLPSELNHSNKEETYTILDLASSNMMHTPSVVFRNGLIKEFPSWFKGSSVADYVLHLLNAKKGMIKYFPDSMAVYRVHGAGVWGKKSLDEVYPKWIALLDNLLKEKFDDEVIKILAAQKTRKIHEYITWVLKEKRYEMIKQICLTYLNSPAPDIANVLVDDIVTHINELEAMISLIKNSGSYSLATKLSNIKSSFLKQ